MQTSHMNVILTYKSKLRISQTWYDWLYDSYNTPHKEN